MRGSRCDDVRGARSLLASVGEHLLGFLKSACVEYPIGDRCQRGGARDLVADAFAMGDGEDAPDFSRLFKGPQTPFSWKKSNSDDAPVRENLPDHLEEYVFVLAKWISIVGLRPALPSEVATYIDYQRQRLLAKQRIACYWQTRKNRDSVAFDGWVDLDLWRLALEPCLRMVEGRDCPAGRLDERLFHFAGYECRTDEFPQIVRLPFCCPLVHNRLKGDLSERMNKWGRGLCAGLRSA